MIRVDMSSPQPRSTRLRDSLGCTSGYVGYGGRQRAHEKGAPQLVLRSAVRQNRKAHPDIFNTLRVLNDVPPDQTVRAWSGLKNTIIIDHQHLGTRDIAGRPRQHRPSLSANAFSYQRMKDGSAPGQKQQFRPGS